MFIRYLSKLFILVAVFLLCLGITVSHTHGAQGDMNNDGRITLIDVVSALQVSASVETTGIDIAGDVNGDAKIGLPEALYALQWVAGLRGGESGTNAALSGLTFSGGAMMPAFGPEVYDYWQQVDNSISEITITATAADPNSSITIEGMPVISGVVSDPVHVDVGLNVVDIVVTAEDGTTTRTYTINVLRQEVDETANAYLANLSLSEGDLNPAFHPDTIQYTANVSSETTQITVTATTQAGGAYLMIGGNPAASGTPSGSISLVDGQNEPIVVQVVSQDAGSSKTYQIVVTRGDVQELSVNAFLAGLTLSGAPLNEVFFPALFSYSAAVANEISSVRVTPIADDPQASVAVNGTTVISGSASGPIALSEGENAITIEVTAQDTNVSRVYNLIVTREGTGTSSQAGLSSLTLSAARLNEPFAPAALNYTACVLQYVEDITVTATAAHPQAAITVNGIPVTSGRPSGTIDLAVGENMLEVAVTAEDGLTTKSYLINVSRHGAPSGVAATVYVVDAPASLPFEFETLPAALSYLSEHLTADQLGEIRIQTTRPMAVNELSIGGNVIITLDPGASNKIVGPGTSALLVNAGGSLDMAGLYFDNAAGVTINSSVGLAIQGSSFSGDTTINISGGIITQSIRYPLEASGAYGFVSQALQFNSGSISGGLTINASGGAAGEQKDIEIANTQASSASLFGSFSESSYLKFKSNLFSELNIDVDLHNQSSLDVTGHMNLQDVNTVLNMDGDAQVNFSSSTMAGLAAEYKGLKAQVNFQNMFVGNAAMKVNNSDFNFVAKNANFNSFNASTSFSSAIGTVGFDLDGAFFEKSLIFSFPDAPVEASVNFALKGITSRGPSEIHAGGRVTCNLQDVILGAEARFIYTVGSGVLNADNTKFLGKVYAQSKDQAFEFNSTITNGNFQDDVFGYFASANLAFHWGGSVEEDHGIVIQGGHEGIYPQAVSRRSALETTENEIVFSGLNIKGSSDRPALFIGDVDVPVTIENSTIKSSQASIVLNSVNGTVTIRNNAELAGGVFINGDPDSSGQMIDHACTITGNTISHNTPGMSCIHTHAIRDVLITDNDMTALGFATHGVHINGGKAIIRGGSIITSGPETCQAIGVGESAGGHNGIVYAEGVEPITGAVQTGPKGYVRLTDNTFSNAVIVDYKEGLTAYPRLLNDPMESNSGLNPDEDIIGSLIDWNEDTHHCPDYPTRCDGWDEEEKECGCGEDGVSPPSEPGV